MGLGRILWLLPVIGALIGGLVIVVTLGMSGGAPQQAAGFALACACSVVPYVLVRSVIAMTDENWQRDIKRIAGAVEKRTSTRPQAEERA